MKSLKKSMVIVSGLAGSGKTIVIHALEDLGFYSIDNLPAVMLTNFNQKEVLSHIHADHIALAIDSRDQETPKVFQAIYHSLHEHFEITILYLTSSEDVIAKRFRENRRQHPLSSQKLSLNLHQAIKLDEKTLQPIKKLAHRTLDTSELSVQSLKRFIYHNFAPSEKNKHLLLHLISFGFKHGTPVDIDTLFDVRCFKNPYYDLTLRHHTGKEEVIKNFVFSDDNVAVFVKKVEEFISFFYPLYLEEGKRYLAIGIGCTGGKHRSVAIVEELAKIFRGHYPLVSVDHRHLERQ